MAKDKGKQVAILYSGPLLGNPTAGPSTNPSASLAALWSYIQPALDHIVRSSTNNLSKAPAIDVEYHMGIHTAVYNYFTSQSESLNNRPHSDSCEKVSGIDLYEKLDKYYSDVARELFLGAPLDDSSLIQYLVPCFNRYSAGAQSVNRLLNYVNRHFVKRAVDEDKGWLRFNDVLDAAMEKMIKEGNARDLPSKKLKEKRTEELRRWGYEDGAPSEVLAQAECSAEAASAADRVVPLSSLAYRRFRIEFLDLLLAVPKTKAKKKTKRPPSNGERPLPKGRLARAVKELLETDGSDEEEKQRLADGLATTLRMVGIRVDHPLRKRLDKFLSFS